MRQHPGEFAAARPISADEATPALSGALASAGSQETTAPATSLRRGLLAAAGAAALVGAGYLGQEYWTVGRFQVSTDDAYVQADNTTIAPKVAGYVAEVLVSDNEPVKAGQALARIDDRDFRVALDQAKADVAAASAAIATKAASLAAQQSAVDAARAAIRVEEANSTFAEQDDRRYASLAASGYGSVQNAQAATSRSAASRAAVQRDEAALEAAIQQIEVLKSERAEAQATLAHDQAAERQAELNLSYTTLVSPVDGVVGARSLRVGQYVQPGAQLMAVVPVSAAYIVANFKETQLADVRPGQKVEIAVDTFPGHPLSGHVDSLAPASGQEFALLPPDNATGNFTKVVQRIPVKIVLETGGPLANLLRPGMSVYPTIDTKAPTSVQSASVSAPRG
jgi:membrane fusion protein (multidrug efflux system)